MIAAAFHPVTLVLATLCIQWVVLASFGTITLKLPYVTLALLIAYAAVSLRRIRACTLFVHQNAAWILPFILYVMLLTASVYGSPAQNTGIRQLFYLAGCIAFAASVAAARDIASVLRIGAGLSIAILMLVVEISAQKIGLSWLDALDAFMGGDLKFVVYSFFREIFRSANPADDVNFVASQKNAIAVCVLVCGLLFRCASDGRWRDVIGLSHLAVVALLLLLLNTRSVIIVGLLSIALATGIRALADGVRDMAALSLKGMAMVAVGVAFIISSDPSPVSDLMADRFAFDDASAEHRVLQAQVALERIGEHPVLGSGYHEVNGYQVHNLFLNAWMNAGIAAFIAVVGFYLVLVARWASFVWNLVKQPEKWLLPVAPEWVAPLPLLPFFRVWLSGDGGNLFLGEWIAVAAFFGLLLANDLKRVAIGSPRPVPMLVPKPWSYSRKQSGAS